MNKIQPNELRVNNLTLNKGALTKVDGLSIYHAWANKEEYFGIELTEEWHNKFGVEIDGHISYVYELPRTLTIRAEVVFSGDYVYLRQRNDDKRFNDSLVTLWNKDLTKRNMYVHEWQNLYQSLTSKELTIK